MKSGGGLWALLALVVAVIGGLVGLFIWKSDTPAPEEPSESEDGGKATPGEKVDQVIDFIKGLFGNKSRRKR